MDGGLQKLDGSENMVHI